VTISPGGQGRKLRLYQNSWPPSKNPRLSHERTKAAPKGLEETLKKRRVLSAEIFILGVLIGASSSIKAFAQNATVTFYTHASKLYGYPGAKHGLFYGRIYDGDHLLFSFRDGFFVKNNRFITLKLPGGPHTFAASYGKDPSKSSQFPIVLETGKSYFVRAQSESKGILIVEVEQGRLDQVTCQAAHQDSDKAKVLSDKTVSPNFAASLVPTQSMPPCP
jgi:hypothetical protein